MCGSELGGRLVVDPQILTCGLVRSDVKGGAGCLQPFASVEIMGAYVWMCVCVFFLSCDNSRTIDPIVLKFWMGVYVI